MNAITILGILMVLGLVIILGTIFSKEPNLIKVLGKGILILIGIGIAWKLLSIVIGLGSTAHGL